MAYVQELYKNCTVNLLACCLALLFVKTSDQWCPRRDFNPQHTSLELAALTLSYVGIKLSGAHLMGLCLFLEFGGQCLRFVHIPIELFGYIECLFGLVCYLTGHSRGVACNLAPSLLNKLFPSALFKLRRHKLFAMK